MFRNTQSVGEYQLLDNPRRTGGAPVEVLSTRADPKLGISVIVERVLSLIEKSKA